LALEAMLSSQIRSELTSALARAAYFKAWQGVFTSEESWRDLRDIWRQHKEIKDLPLAESDFMIMAYELALRKPSEASAIYDEELARIRDPERKLEFRFVMGALVPASLDARDRFFESLRLADNRKNEPWVTAALNYVHHPLRGLGSEEYLAPSLSILEEIRQTSGIFFPLDWLTVHLRYHITPSARAVVDGYLKSHPELERGLRQKLLQAADPLFRFTSAQNSFAHEIER
jgi:aminopeptidase N